MAKQNKRRLVVTLEDGTEFTVSPVSQTLITMAAQAVHNEYAERGEKITPPTYTVKTATGESEEVHDATTIETDEDRKAWGEYQETLKRMKAEMDERTMMAWLTGVNIDVPEDGEWRERQEFLGVEIPEKPMQLKYHYLTTEVLTTPDDLIETLGALAKVTAATTVDPKEIDQAMDSFRSEIRRNSNLRVDDTEEQVAVQQTIDGTDGDEGVGDKSKAVRSSNKGRKN